MAAPAIGVRSSQTPTEELNDTRSRLVEAAATLVHAQSYNSVGVQAICDASGVRKGSFYHFFASKQALMLAALDSLWERFLHTELAACRDGSLPPRSAIEAMIDEIAVRQARHQQDSGRVLGCSFGNLAAEEASLDDLIRLRLNRIFDDWTAIVADVLTRAQKRGEIRLCDGSLVAAREVIASLQGLMLLAKVANEPQVVATAGRLIVDQLWGCQHGDD